jgi:hypothetical protein
VRKVLELRSVRRTNGFILMGRIHQDRDRYRRDAGAVTREERDRRRGALISGGPYRAIEIVDGDAITQPTLRDVDKIVSTRNGSGGSLIKTK